MRSIIAKVRATLKSLATLGRKPVLARDAKAKAINPGSVVIHDEETATVLHTTKLGRLSLIDEFGHRRFWWPDQVVVVK